MARLTRKEIKHDIREDQVRVGIERTFEYVSRNSRTIVAVAVGVIALILGVFAVRYFLEKRQDEASQALGRAVAVAQAPIDEEAANPNSTVMPSFSSEEARKARAKELLQGVIDEHGGASSDVAKVYLARILFEEGETERAVELWKEFVDEHPRHMLAASVKVNLLELDRAAGETERVVQELRESLESKTPTLPNDIALFELGRSLEELERRDEARDAYRRLADEYPDSPYAREAQAKVGELEPAAA